MSLSVDSGTPNKFYFQASQEAIESLIKELKAALHKLTITIRLDVFNNSVPSNFMLWPCCGDSFDDSLFCVWHPDGLATVLTNTNFT